MLRKEEMLQKESRMGEKNCFRKGIIGILFLISFFIGGCLEQNSETDSKTGFLEGNITISPLCPVEPCNIPEEQKAEIYLARTLQIYTEDGELVKGISVGPEGHIKTELKAGKYIVDMKPLGIDRTADLPEKIQILPGETAHLEISIDTGIR